jgi:P-type Ca2+ transporter type 2C
VFLKYNHRVEKMSHEKSIDTLEKEFITDINFGLTEKEAQRRIKISGKNALPKGKRTSWYLFFIRQFKNPLVYILLFGAIVTAFLARWLDMAVILLAMGINIFVGFIQEFKSDNILKKLRDIVYVKALVYRGGHIVEIDSRNLVPGDVIVLKAGHNVPADARIITSHNLFADQATLTGEPTPDKKWGGIMEPNTQLSDRSNMVYAGTTITSGFGKALVCATGAQTQIGKIALLTQRSHDEPTPLQEKMAVLGKTLVFVVLILAFLIFIIGSMNPQFSIEEMLITAIAVAVAGVPEGLPAAISIILAVSAQRILKRKGVIRNLLAAETLGSATVIATDKTGTLTEGKMQVEKVYGKDAARVRRVGALANEAMIEDGSEGTQSARGEPTDVAKLTHFIALGGNTQELEKEYPQIGIRPFDSDDKYIATLHKTSSTPYYLAVSGAPEFIIDRSVEVDKKALLKENEELAARGFRVIACADKSITRAIGKDMSSLSDKEMESLVKNLTFVGFMTITDPIRDDVAEAIREARGAGIRTIMITGDHALTAVSVAKQLSFDASQTALTGSFIDSLSDEELSDALSKHSVFARTTPEHKMRIIKILRANGEVVAMTGDGINDAPGLRGADIGIALGSGTDIAREASDLVLLNNNFATIVEAIKQGRVAFSNIRKVSVLLLTSSFSEIILIMSALLIPVFFKSIDLLPLPLTALQILYVNLVEDTLPNIAMAFEPEEKNIMSRRPIPKGERILNKESIVIIFFVGLLIDVALVLLFLYLFFNNLPVELIQTVIFAAIGIDTLLYVFSIKSLREPIWRAPLFNNKFLLVAVLFGFLAVVLGVYAPVLNNVLGTVPLPISLVALVMGLAIIKMTFIEIVKIFFRSERTLTQ